MKIDLSKKAAIVTGSTGGIGFAIAKGLPQTGATVVLNGRQQTAVDEAIYKLKGSIPTAWCAAWPPILAPRKAARPLCKPT